MDFVSLGFLALFCIVGGFVAVFADRWGRALGKQRRTIFGLRPRRTAELIVFLSGVFIPLATILLVMAVSADVREWITRGRFALAEVEQRKVEIRKLEAAGERLRVTNDGLEARNKELLNDREKLQAQVSDLRSKAATYQAEALRAGRQVAKLRSDIARERSDLLDVQKRLATQIREYDKLVTEKDRVAKEKERLDGSYAELSRQWSELEEAYRKLLDDIDAKKGEVETLTADKSRLVSDLAAKQGELAGVQKDLRDAEASLASVNSQLAQVTAQYEQAFISGFSSRFQKLTFSLNDEVVRFSVDMNLTPQEARAALSQLLRTARTAAEQRGAKASSRMPSADLGPKTVDNRQLTSEEQQDALVNLMTGQPDPLVVIATSFTNSFQGEPVQLSIGLYRNPIVFRVGDVLADSRIDGSKEVGEVYRQLVAYFEDQVRAVAKRRGVIPVVGREDPFGSVPSEVVLDLVWRIKGVGRAIRVQTVSTADTRAGDALRLDYILR